MKKDSEVLLQEAYDEIFAKIIEMVAVKKYEPQLIAATLMAQALRIYKTILSEQDYIKMVDTMADGAINVDAYKDKRILN
jgi:hypothetical protein